MYYIRYILITFTELINLSELIRSKLLNNKISFDYINCIIFFK